MEVKKDTQHSSNILHAHEGANKQKTQPTAFQVVNAVSHQQNDLNSSEYHFCRTIFFALIFSFAMLPHLINFQFDLI